jgi:hypothetical protein
MQLPPKQGVGQWESKVYVYPKVGIAKRSRLVIPFSIGIDPNVVKISPVQQVVNPSKKGKTPHGFRQPKIGQKIICHLGQVGVIRIQFSCVLCLKT